MAEVSRMHIYILLDTSGSIEREEFEKSRDATIALIRKVSIETAQRDDLRPNSEILDALMILVYVSSSFSE